MSPLEIVRVPCLRDNYGFLVRDRATGAVATIDTPEVAPLEAALDERGWTLTHILNTHHHADHAGGNAALKARWGCTVTGPRGEADEIPGIDREVGDGDVVELGALRARVWDVPGHTRGHIAYLFDGNAFVGDTMFVMGCGRLFEGTPAQMWTSLSRLRSLPPDTVIWCAHEYTLSNARFALTVDPANEALRARFARVEALRAEGTPTVPSTVGEERATNPFLRADDPAVAAQVGLSGAPAVEVFAEVRRRKDNF
jgi:hydroxyacylglutathione hydrolase